MKNAMFLLGLLMVFSTCSRENNVKPASEGNNEIETASENVSVQELKIIKYVNAPSRLRVRNSPDINAERIGVLDNLTEVLVLKEGGINLTIDGINGKWTFIETDDIQGWVFGGFLSSNNNSFISIESIAEYFFILNPTVRERIFFSMEEVAKYFSNFQLISEETFRSVHDENVIYKVYSFRGNEYIFSAHVFDTHATVGFTVAPIELRLDETNYLDLFPYQTYNEFLLADNFGAIHEVEPNMISYFLPSRDDIVYLLFDNGLLKSVIMGWFIP